MVNKLVIAGKQYRIRYELPDRDEIEERAKAGPYAPSLMEVMTSGRVRDQALVVWAGIKGANHAAKVTPRGLIEAFQAHADRGGDYYQDIVIPAYLAAAEAGLLGRSVDLAELKRIFGVKEGKDEEPPEDEAPATVRAAE